MINLQGRDRRRGDRRRGAGELEIDGRGRAKPEVDTSDAVNLEVAEKAPDFFYSIVEGGGGAERAPPPRVGRNNGNPTQAHGVVCHPCTAPGVRRTWNPCAHPGSVVAAGTIVRTLISDK